MNETTKTDLPCTRTKDCRGKVERDVAYYGKTVHRCTLNSAHAQYLIFIGKDPGLHNQ